MSNNPIPATIQERQLQNVGPVLLQTSNELMKPSKNQLVALGSKPNTSTLKNVTNTTSPPVTTNAPTGTSNIRKVTLLVTDSGTPAPKKVTPRKRKQLSDDLIDCKACLLRLKNSKAYYDHLQNTHHFEMHKLIAHEAIGYYCMSCHKSTRDHHACINKVQLPNPHAKYKKCGHCQRVFKNVPEFHTHLITEHKMFMGYEVSQAYLDQGIEDCSLCNIVFPTFRKLARHLDKEHEVKDGMLMYCAPCHKYYHNIALFHTHMKKHHGTYQREQEKGQEETEGGQQQTEGGQQAVTRWVQDEPRQETENQLINSARQTLENKL